MILESENKTIKIRLTNRKIIELCDKFKTNNIQDLYFKALNEKNIKTLAKIIFELAEDEDGKKAFTNNDINQTYDFLDNYMEKNKKTYEDMFNELAEYINNEGFFMKRYNTQELEAMKSDLLAGMDMNAVVQEAMKQIATEELVKTI